MSTTDSASYAEQVARLLWPEPWGAPRVTRSRHRPGSADRDAYVFPSPSRPRLLVPADVPGAASMLQRLGGGRSTLGGTRRALERAVRSRAFVHTRWPVLRIGAAAPGTDSIEQHISDRFGTEVRVGIMLGTRRVNQKPVLQVFDASGGLLAYAKIGHNELTSALVRREATALSAVRSRRPAAFDLPHVLDHSVWSGLDVLAISALATDPGRRPTAAARTAVMREVAHLNGTSTGPLADSTYWGRVRSSAERFSDTPRGDRLLAALDSLEHASGDQPVEFGSWHGDCGMWNMGLGDGIVKLWDWERYDADVPLGFDGVHLAAQAVQPGRRTAATQERDFLASLPRHLDTLGVPRAQHQLTLRLYLLEIALRYEHALAAEPLPSLESRTSWVLALLERLSGPASRLTKGRP